MATGLYTGLCTGLRALNWLRGPTAGSMILYTFRLCVMSWVGAGVYGWWCLLFTEPFMSYSWWFRVQAFWWLFFLGPHGLYEALLHRSAPAHVYTCALASVCVGTCVYVCVYPWLCVCMRAQSHTYAWFRAAAASCRM